MNEKILITYASRTGSTAEIAAAIASTLQQENIPVDILPMEDVRELSGYSAVIIGSPIRKSQWLPEAKRFFQTHRTELTQKRVATFTVCITLAMSNAEQYQRAVREWIAPIRAEIRTVSEGLFAGRLDFSKLPWSWDILLLRATVAVGIFPKGDRRDWNAVHAWAANLPQLLLQQQ
jgi:menaquinone-dependent protoporphyrinogen oxidase